MESGIDYVFTQRNNSCPFKVLNNQVICQERGQNSVSIVKTGDFGCGMVPRLEQWPRSAFLSLVLHWASAWLLCSCHTAPPSCSWLSVYLAVVMHTHGLGPRILWDSTSTQTCCGQQDLVTHFMLLCVSSYWETNILHGEASDDLSRSW